jgi:hypothetical protein
MAQVVSKQIYQCVVFISHVLLGKPDSVIKSAVLLVDLSSASLIMIFEIVLRQIKVVFKDLIPILMDRLLCKSQVNVLWIQALFLSEIFFFLNKMFVDSFEVSEPNLVVILKFFVIF